MNFDQQSWHTAPVRTGVRVAKSLLRRAVPQLSLTVVPYDADRSHIFADLRTPLGLGIYRYGHYDPDIEIVGQLLEPGELFVDGGAHVGLFTLVGARRVGPAGRVIAFEPSTRVRRRLLDNVGLNGFHQVEVRAEALSSEPGEASMRVFELSGSGLNHLGPAEGEAGAIETVKVTTLDRAIDASDRPRLRVMKLDLEGAEHAALRGAAELFQTTKPHLLLEIEAPHLARMGTSVAAIEQELRGHGYTFFKTGADTAGRAFITAISALADAAPRPNVLATVDPADVRRRGVAIR